jgi:hypothetical protein
MDAHTTWVALTQPRLPTLSQMANDTKKILPEVDELAKVVTLEAGLSAK